ncbi:polyprenyl synthetase family protein [Candidatus Dojkabacteria bacterium]|nr:polyprenyl synthetase family protein [Candidatus Dojkabacteria bacterium]
MEKTTSKSHLAKILLSKHKRIAESRLKLFFREEIKRSAKLSQFSRQVTKELAELTLTGGKRLRAALAFYSYKMLGGNNEKEMMKTSIFIELIQTYLLIHDDIIDRSAERRGFPTIHKTFSAFSKNAFPSKDHRHFGKSIAICAGDLSCHLALKLLSESNFNNKRKISAIKTINEQLTTVIHGEMLDIQVGNKPKATEKEVIDMLKMKTATYTYETPVLVGAILAGTEKRKLKILSDYSINAGIGFQIQDDILGLFGQKEKTGKSVSSDLAEGKKTLLIVKALEEASKGNKAFILKTLGNKNLTKKSADIVRDIIIKTGALDYSKKLALQYVVKAKKALNRININNEGKDFLEGITDYVINRSF